MAESTDALTISYYYDTWDRWLRVYFCRITEKMVLRPIWANVFQYGLATLTAAAAIYLYPSPLICNAGAFVIGFSAAGGILQCRCIGNVRFFP